MQEHNSSLIYCNSLTWYSRLLTREVKVGDLGIGGSNPIRVQSMTTTDTMDTNRTVEQSIRMIDAGCELVRITAPSINEAKNLGVIKAALQQRGYHQPICADIHFTPNAAEAAARIVEKVRVNPGNYADRKKFETIEYTDASYDQELERIGTRFIPLVKICKEYGTAMRIGTNHGSLSDRIMSRYGDSPLGMVESALEFLRICESENYFNIVLSMKSSNTQVMVQAYRLLVMKMKEEGMHYPLHLGVTEAGEGEDGRIKSATGIGTLLEDGLGDTIRVSLTEDPEFEIPVARELVKRYENRSTLQQLIPEIKNIASIGEVYSPIEHNRRITTEAVNIGGHQVPRVVGSLKERKEITPASLFPFGYNYAVQLDKWNIADQACDYIFTGDTKINFETPGTLGLIYNYKTWQSLADKTRCYPLYSFQEFQSAKAKSEHLNFISVSIHDLISGSPLVFDHHTVLIFETSNEHGMAEQRRMFFELLKQKISAPVIIKRNYAALSDDTLMLHAATDCGGLLIDGFGDGVWLEAGNNAKLMNSLSFGILQAARTRTSKTEYISCPSCGRTLFDLQETTAKIRSRTDHLKGIKIAIMGCIVNGPGEMADADYGYVGSGPGKITLYKGKEVVKKAVPTEQAVDELIALIRENGDWVEATQLTTLPA
ncbi:MAG: (E)-4-hydroxy-3-methylbut-2-enyl-diphosphate synthase [Bacteroidota bacterium]